MKRLLVAAGALLLLAGCADRTAHGPSTQSLAGKWRVHDANDPALAGWRADDGQWQSLRVPANWYVAGLDHQGALWYRTQFSLPPLRPDNMATLVFKGVDYHADAWLNQRPVGRHTGYFQRFSLDISEEARRDNQLAVRVDSPFESPDSTWPLHKNVIKGVFSQHDARPGGAWTKQGQDANTGGIWAPVDVHISRGAVIDNVLTTPAWQQGLAHPALTLAIDYRTNRDRPAMLHIRVKPHNFSGKSYTFNQPVNLAYQRSGAQSLQVTLPMAGAALWWPKGYGDPNLYEVEVSLTDNLGVMDRTTTRTGLRQIVKPAQGGWVINGKRIFLRGTNYIGSSWLSAMKPADWEKDLELLEEMNANAIRVHGHIASHELYELADERGMLIWQDMPLQWGYNDSPEFAQEAARQATDAIRQYGNYPSIIVWGGQNEPPFDSLWMQKRFPDWYPEMNKNLAQKVADALAQDTTRIMHPWSSVTEHFWQGWYFGTINDFLQPAKNGIITEFGAEALPNLETLKTIIPEKDLWPATTQPGDPGWAIWKYHNFQPVQTFQFAKIERGPTIQTFIENTQRYQADSVRTAAESYRRQRYQPVSVLFQFMFVETWPSINWGVMDYRRQPKLGYYALQKAYQPILPSIEPVTLNWKSGAAGKVNLWAINDTLKAYPKARLAWTITQDNRVLAAGEQRLDMAADSGVKLAAASAVPQGGAPVTVTSRLYDRWGNLLGANDIDFTLQK
ncbi:glycoside hydrolase family 2 protein [Nissabacter sp. SGAir0207]|uniref:glycoside hydrolase family 2 protein n=1 Tax=Nissabacter sp. SGAir0207 TaxID=2126321 RepID=UPI0010CCD329|nr:glycoside hydrolase family 2 TIM barrel-domain containing protein [Nissabacter sp. SGAir0207]QCR38539.1 glycoside hydrolase family 2 [Nissabacter sp. SGAir0207]